MTEPLQKPEDYSKAVAHLEDQFTQQLILPDSPIPEPERSSSDNETKQVDKAQEKLEYYCIALDDMLEIGKKFIDGHRELKSLREIRRALSIKSPGGATGSNNNSSDRYAVIEDTIPEELKCPVCFEIFEDEVQQCKNGHSICSRCCETLTECPECRASYRGGKIRNRTVEKLMSSLKIDCLYNGAGCREKLICAEMQVHVETCEFMNKPVRSPEYKEVRRQIRTRDGDSKRIEKRMQETNKRLIESKAAWIKAHGKLGSQDLASLEQSINAFQLKARETEMTALYVDLNKVITPS